MSWYIGAFTVFTFSRYDRSRQEMTNVSSHRQIQSCYVVGWSLCTLFYSHLAMVHVLNSFASLVKQSVAFCQILRHLLPLFLHIFSIQLLSVLRGHSFFHPCHNGQWPPTLKDFYPDLIHYNFFSYLNSSERDSISLFYIEC